MEELPTTYGTADFASLFVESYRLLFTDITCDEYRADELSHTVSRMLVWNSFSVFPRCEELEAILTAAGYVVKRTKMDRCPAEHAIYSKEVHDFIAALKSSNLIGQRDGQIAPKSNRFYSDFHALLAEWALLQLVCSRAQLHLVKSAVDVLRRQEAHDPPLSVN